MKRYSLIPKEKFDALKRKSEGLTNEIAAASVFIDQLRSGNLVNDYSGNEDSPLTISLNQLREQLSLLITNEQRRNWTNEGLAKFSDLLRLHQQDPISDLLNEVIKTFVHYLSANQGCIFIAKKNEDEQEELVLTGCYAYNRRKYLTKSVRPGEGLIGQCFLEKDLIFLTDIPENFITITSGLGEALPRSIIILPLLHDGQPLGIVELASFKKFEQYEIDFAKKVCENIAATCNALQINQQTIHLLKESQMQAEQLRSTEEEMRQNLEELSASQDEMRRIQLETEAQNNIINSMAIVSKTDVQGNITYVNEQFLQWSKYTREEVIGKNHRILKSGHQPDEIFDDLWHTISSGKIWRGEVKNKAKDGSYYWVDAIIAPVLDNNGKPKEYIAQRFVINDKKKREEENRLLLTDSQAKEEELRQNMEELHAQQEEMQRIMLEMEAQTNIINSTAIVSKTDVRGNITYVNEQFLAWSQYTKDELIGQNHRILKSGDQPDEIFDELWATISSGKIWRGEVKNKAKDGSHYWVDAIIAPILDSNGKPKEYIAQRFVINDKKKKELEMKLLLEETQAKEEELRQNAEELNAQQETLQRLLREEEAQTNIINSTAIVSKTDLKGNITYVNEQFVKWSGYAPDEVIGKNHRILKSGHQEDEIFSQLWSTISGGKIWRGEVKNKAKDGSYYWVDAIIAPVLDERGKPKEYIAQRFVINEQKSKEELLNKLLTTTITENGKHQANAKR